MEPEGVPSRARPVTIHDIAALTGVNASTVSRALNRPGRINASTEARIRSAAEKLQYVPNRQARALSSGTTHTVALLLSDVTNPFFFGIIRGAQDQLRSAGYAQLLVDSDDSGESEAQVLRRLRASVDGAVLAASRMPDAEIAALAVEVPLVTINRNIPGVRSVVVDTPHGVVLAMEHLAGLGHRNVVYAAGPAKSWSSEARWNAICKAATRLGVSARRLGPYVAQRASGSDAADAVLASGATACLSFNDMLAIGMLARWRERGVRVPEDISVVGCDDIFGADFCRPALTTITAPITQAGRAAVSLLLAGFETGPRSPAGPPIVLPTHLTVRESTAVPAAAGSVGAR